jgi:two-component system, chemotaxis family, chemotaxis protein CheY
VHALIVDDSRYIRETLTQMLRGRDLECTAVEDGHAGLECLGRSGPYDVALVDWNMPVMSGLEMVKAVRSDPKLNALKILMVTSEAESQVIEAALDAGANEYLMKPFDEDGLMQKLEMIGVLPG